MALPANKRTYFKRVLPSPPAIAFSSAEGREIFAEALPLGTVTGFFKLIEQFTTQGEPEFCGLAAISMTLNALGIDPRRTWKGAWRWFSETMLDCCKSMEDIKREGITLNQAACLARCNGADVSVHRYGSFDGATFRGLLREVCASEDRHIVVSYGRKAFNQSGDGHFSPIGGYNPVRDLALILDVARFKYAPHWVRVDELIGAMGLLDPAIGRPRGFLILSSRQPRESSLFSLDLSLNSNPNPNLMDPMAPEPGRRDLECRQPEPECRSASSRLSAEAVTVAVAAAATVGEGATATLGCAGASSSSGVVAAAVAAAGEDGGGDGGAKTRVEVAAAAAEETQLSSPLPATHPLPSLATPPHPAPPPGLMEAAAPNDPRWAAAYRFITRDAGALVRQLLTRAAVPAAAGEGGDPDVDVGHGDEEEGGKEGGKEEEGGTMAWSNGRETPACAGGASTVTASGGGVAAGGVVPSLESLVGVLVAGAPLESVCALLTMRPTGATVGGKETLRKGPCCGCSLVRGVSRECVSEQAVVMTPAAVTRSGKAYGGGGGGNDAAGDGRCGTNIVVAALAPCNSSLGRLGRRGSRGCCGGGDWRRLEERRVEVGVEVEVVEGQQQQQRRRLTAPAMAAIEAATACVTTKTTTAAVAGCCCTTAVAFVDSEDSSDVGLSSGLGSLESTSCLSTSSASDGDNSSSSTYNSNDSSSSSSRSCRGADSTSSCCHGEPLEHHCVPPQVQALVADELRFTNMYKLVDYWLRRQRGRCGHVRQPDLSAFMQPTARAAPAAGVPSPSPMLSQPAATAAAAATAVNVHTIPSSNDATVAATTTTSVSSSDVKGAAAGVAAVAKVEMAEAAAARLGDSAGERPGSHERPGPSSMMVACDCAKRMGALPELAAEKLSMALLMLPDADSWLEELGQQQQQQEQQQQEGARAAAAAAAAPAAASFCDPEEKTFPEGKRTPPEAAAAAAVGLWPCGRVRCRKCRQRAAAAGDRAASLEVLREGWRQLVRMAPLGLFASAPVLQDEVSYLRLQLSQGVAGSGNELP